MDSRAGPNHAIQAVPAQGTAGTSLRRKKKDIRKTGIPISSVYVQLMFSLCYFLQFMVSPISTFMLNTLTLNKVISFLFYTM